MKALNIKTLRDFIQDYVVAEPQRMNVEGWWQTPLLVSAPVDSRFGRLTQIAAENHLHPCDLLPDAHTVIVFFIPFVKKLVKGNKPGTRPTRDWAVSYVETNDLIERLGKALENLLQQWGYQSGLTPATHNFDEVKLMARWSHKHLGYLAGLGRFGAHNLLITPAGCAGRLGSLVTNAYIGDHPLMRSAHACLLKAGKECGKCIQACPVDALAQDGFERRGCWDRLNENRRDLFYLADLPESTHVCGKCAALMPCSFTNPVREA